MLLLKQLGKIDIYLLDQVMRGRIPEGSLLLDAGCGYGRNSEFFIRNNYMVHGIDQNADAIIQLREQLSQWNASYPMDHFQVGTLKQMPYESDHFDFIICSAVLHFAQNRKHFIAMFEELVRVLKKGGTLWFRMTTKHTIEQKAEQIEGDVYFLPDGSTRYLLDRQVLAQLMKKHQLVFLDPFKTVNVSDIRTMATVVLQKSIRINDKL